MKNVAIYTHATTATEGLVEKLQKMGCNVRIYTQDDMRYRENIHGVDTVFYFMCGCCHFAIRDLAKFYNADPRERSIILVSTSPRPTQIHGIMENPSVNELIRAAMKMHKKSVH